MFWWEKPCQWPLLHEAAIEGDFASRTDNHFDGNAAPGWWWERESGMDIHWLDIISYPNYWWLAFCQRITHKHWMHTVTSITNVMRHIFHDAPWWCWHFLRPCLLTNMFCLCVFFPGKQVVYKGTRWLCRVDTLTVSTKERQLKHRHASDASGQAELMVCARWDALVPWPKSAVLLHAIEPTQVSGEEQEGQCCCMWSVFFF